MATLKSMPIVDMNVLARRLNSPEDYAPPAVREDPGLAAITKGLSQILAELTEVRRAAKAEVDALEAEAEAIEQMYKQQSDKKIAEFKRCQEGMRMAMEMMAQLRDNCAKLDETP